LAEINSALEANIIASTKGNHNGHSMSKIPAHNVSR